MRMMMKVNMTVEAGNRAVKANKLGQTIQAILADQKPEAVYFCADNGQRTGYVIVNIKEASEIPKLAEPWFLAFNAAVELQPVMVPEDLAKAGPAIEEAARKYA